MRLKKGARDYSVTGNPVTETKIPQITSLETAWRTEVSFRKINLCFLFYFFSHFNIHN